MEIISRIIPAKPRNKELYFEKGYGGSTSISSSSSSDNSTPTYWELITTDETGKPLEQPYIKTVYPAVSEKEISAYGLGTGSGSGTAYERLDRWADYAAGKEGWVLSALLGNNLDTRVSLLEGGSATTVNTTGTGNAITSLAKSGTIITATKGLTFAELDASGKVLSSQLPSYVDDVIEATSLSAFPLTGESGKIYIAQDTNKTYRWSGTAYTEISASIALGETSSTAYRGDRGKTAYDHSQLEHQTIINGTGFVKASGKTLSYDNNTYALNSTLTSHTGDNVKHITATERTNWNLAYTNNHTHANKSIIDQLSQSNLDVLSKLSLVNGKLQISVDTYSTGELSAYGAGTGGGGNGGGIIETVYGYSNLGQTFNNSILTDTFNAYTVNQINTRLVAVESGSATTINTTGAGNAITSISKSGTVITANKGLSFALSAHTLGSHSDVTITTLASGEILKWNGTNWINNTLAEAGIASVSQLGNYLPLTGGTLTGALTIGNGSDLFLKAPSGSVDSGDIVFLNGNGVEIHRLWAGTGTLSYRANIGIDYSLIHSGNYNSYSPTLTGTGASGTWGINITGNAATATNIANSGTVTLATATESNAITITQPSYVSGKPVKLLNFNWYATTWSLGNIRGGSTDTQGLGIYLDGVEKFRFLDGSLKVGSDTVYHSGNFNPANYLPLSGGTLTGALYTNEWFRNNLSGYGLYNQAENAHWYAYNGYWNSSKDIKVGNNIVWHAGNDGHNSGLDADLLDGVQGSGYGRAYSGSYAFGGSMTAITTAQFITLLQSLGAFSTQYWTARGSWGYADNQYITDTGFGNVHLAGTVVEVFGISTAYTIVIHTPSTSGLGSLVNRTLVYQNNGSTYSPGWRLIANTSDNVASATKLQTARTIWGQSFDGTGNVSGDLTGVSSINMTGSIITPNIVDFLNGGAAQGINIGSLLVSNNYGHRSNVPTNGIWSSGEINSNGSFNSNSGISNFYDLGLNGVGSVGGGVASSGILFRGSGIAHGNLIWLPNERTFAFRGGGSPRDTSNPYGLVNLDVPRNINSGNDIFAAGVSYAGYGFTVNTSAGTGTGISLYGGSSSINPGYGLMFAQTSYKGTHGAVTGDWATYFTIDSAVNRGWIFTTNASGTSGNVASISNSGNITANGEITAFVASDLRLKENIKLINNSLDLIDKLNPVSYNWNSLAKELNPNKSDDTDYGLIAQEVEKILPNVVHGIFDNKYKSIDYIKLVPILISAVKELREEINKLK